MIKEDVLTLILNFFFLASSCMKTLLYTCKNLKLLIDVDFIQQTQKEPFQVIGRFQDHACSQTSGECLA